MAGLTLLSRAQFRAIAANQFEASLIAYGIPLEEIPDTGPDSVMGAVCDALSAVAEQLQYQAAQDQASSRLATTPPNADGTVSADAASYAAPWGIVPAGGGYASSNTFQLNFPSPLTMAATVPCGFIIQRSDQVQYLIIADTSQADYNGSQGYTADASASYMTVTAVCLSQGVVGNVANPASVTWTGYSGPGSITVAGISSITNASPITNGTSPELQTAFVDRFTLAMQNGQWGTQTAIIAKALGVQAGLTVSYGDHVNAAGDTTNAYFTLVVNVIGQSTTPSSTLTDAIAAALLNTRSGGIQYQVIAPTLVTPTITGNVAVYSGNNQQTVLANVQTAVQNAVNAIGLDQDGGTTTLSYAQTLALMIGVAGVNPAGTTLAFNSGTSDVTAPFASQIVCPTAPSFTVS